MATPRPPALGRARAPERPGGLARRAVTSTLCRVGTVVLAGTLVAGGLGEVHHQHVEAGERAAVLAAERAAAVERAQAEAHQVRTARAATQRLTGAAVRFAAVRRVEALAIAREAVRAAEAVVVSSSPEAPPTLAPLGQAAAELVALIDTTPAAPVAGRAETRARAQRTGVRSDAPPPGTPAPGTATGDAGVGTTAAPPVPGSPSAPAPEAPPTPAAAAPEAPSAAPTRPPSDPRAPSSSEAGPTATSSSGTVTETPAPVAPSTGAAPGPAAAPTPTTGAAPVSTLATADTLRALDLTVSAEVLAAAQRLGELSLQVQAEADAARAAAAAQAAAEVAARAAAEEAARAAAQELERRVAAADAAPNGEIPAEVLCPLEIEPDALLRCDAAEAFDRLAAAYRTDVGSELDVVSSYRSFDAQVAVKAARGGLAAAPGRSNHGRGIAVDLGDFGGVGQFTAPAYLWMKQHAAEFGWYHPAAMEPGGSAPQEPWHWEYGTDDDRTAAPARR